MFKLSILLFLFVSSLALVTNLQSTNADCPYLNCPDNYDLVKCKCVCALTQKSCKSYQIFDAASCSCKCRAPQPKQCPNSIQVFNKTTCSCQCPEQAKCKAPFLYIANSREQCACVCPVILADCKANKFFNHTSCSCEFNTKNAPIQSCPNTKCKGSKILNLKGCKCQCPSKTCLDSQNYNMVSCVCEPKTQQNNCNDSLHKYNSLNKKCQCITKCASGEQQNAYTCICSSLSMASLAVMGTIGNKLLTDLSFSSNGHEAINNILNLNQKTINAPQNVCDAPRTLNQKTLKCECPTCKLPKILTETTCGCTCPQQSCTKDKKLDMSDCLCK